MKGAKASDRKPWRRAAPATSRSTSARFSGLQKASHAAMRRRCTSIGTTKSAAEAGSRSSPARANESSMRCVRP